MWLVDLIWFDFSDCRRGRLVCWLDMFGSLMESLSMFWLAAKKMEEVRGEKRTKEQSVGYL